MSKPLLTITLNLVSENSSLEVTRCSLRETVCAIALSKNELSLLSTASQSKDTTPRKAKRQPND
ncbi:MAG: hypothetical protein GVY17_02170 [Cyanobacteria bacterium]|nr:hypothetical protein [Cyanobacteria bacterium GSL.Bin21]